jgi:aminopeptidase N
MRRSHMQRLLVTGISLALASASFGVLAAPVAPASSTLTPTQLPRGVVPSHYDVSIVPHAAAMTFDGQVTITVDVQKPTASITLNAIDMAFSRVSLTPTDGKPMAAPKVGIDTEKQTATFTFAKPVAVGTYTLAMTYTGKIGTQANGLFALDYDTKGGKQRALYTQFENSDARRFIPSWDEPAYKASFNLDVTVPSDEMAVSNMPAASTTKLANGLSKVTFQPSPKMSTYLLFFGLGHFDRATTMSDGTEIGVIAQKGSVGQADFALKSAKDVLHEYNQYFGVPYPLPKLDNIAAPGQSQFFSAMENWGAIFTFEYSLLLNPAIATQSDKQEVFNTAAHEMAHQWFGDLVTMRWWDNLWLNEGFASWMASRTTEKLHPEWHTNLYAVGVREGAMSVDAVSTTHPIVQNIATVEQASQAFDTITYSKGEAVISMLEGYVGDDAWRAGVQRYIKAHAYGNTVSDDLWKAVDASGTQPITAIAHDFTLQPGIPLIRVEAAACKGGNTTLSLSQGEFTRDRPDKTPLRWHVPVIAQSIGGKPVSTLVIGGHGTLSVPGCGPVVVNAGQSGYYRTLYTPVAFAALGDSFTKLPEIDELGLMNDTWALGMAGLQPASDALDLGQHVAADASPELWEEIAGTLAALDNYYKGDAPHQAALRKFAIARLSPAFARIGWTPKADESGPTKILRSELIATLSQLGDSAVIAKARDFYAHPDSMPSELRKSILYVVATHADAATWDKLHAQAQAETTPLIKTELYGLLATSQDNALAQRALDLSLTSEPGATTSAGMISGVSRRHPDMAFDFAVAHRSQVDKLVDSTSSSRYYPGLAGSSMDPAMIAKIEAYAKAHIAVSSRRAANTVIAGIRYRMMIREKRLPTIDAWLAKNGG